jgi:hypothetical protein
MEHTDDVLLGAALQAAAASLGPGAAPQAVLARTWEFFRGVTRPTVNLAATVTISRNGKISAFYQLDSPEEPLMTAMTVDQTADIVINETDDHGNPTADTLTWTGSDGGTLLTLTVSADTKSCHVVPVGGEGTGITVTATDPAGELDPVTGLPPSFTASFDLGPGQTSALQGTVTVNG